MASVVLTSCAPAAASVSRSSHSSSASRRDLSRRPNGLGSFSGLRSHNGLTRSRKETSAAASAAVLVKGAGGPPRVTMSGAYVCKDCGYIYNDKTPFDDLSRDYACPVCAAPKRRFKPYVGPIARNSNDTAQRKARKAALQKQQQQSGAAIPIIAAVSAAVIIGSYLYFNSLY